jgi:hypothetical protein
MRMDAAIGKTILESDVRFLQVSAHRLEDRLRSAAPVYIAFCISVAGGLIAAGNLVAKVSNVSLAKLVEDNRWPLAITTGFLSLLAILRILEFARDRKHYRKICGALNDLRQHAVRECKLAGSYAQLWSNPKLKSWPPDSASTISLLTLSVATLTLESMTLALCQLTVLDNALICIITLFILTFAVLRISQ